jgi:RNase P/RNase MRP subunit p29
LAILHALASTASVLFAHFGRLTFVVHCAVRLEADGHLPFAGRAGMGRITEKLAARRGRQICAVVVRRTAREIVVDHRRIDTHPAPQETARFAAELRNGETVRKADGVLLVKKPDRFRLRLMSFLGPTVLDYTSVAEHTRIELPLQGKHVVDGEVPSDAAMSPADLRQAFLRADAAFPGECTPQAEGDDDGDDGVTETARHPMRWSNVQECLIKLHV